MLPYKESLGEKVFRRWAWSRVLTAMIAAWFTLLSIPAAAETDSAPEESLLEIKPWMGDFDGMAERREIRALGIQ